jgi:general secretion pathway protein I
VRGFTLLEVMVALAIMAGVVLTILSSVNYHLSLTGRNQEEAAAVLLARVKIEELELLSSKDLAQAKEGTFTPEWPDYSWKAEISPLPVPLLKKLTVTVTWGAERRTLSLDTYVSQ